MGERVRVCIFCAKRPANSLEHIFVPNWAAEEVRRVGRPIRTDWEGRAVFPKEPVARVVCRKCNNEWMSEIESAAKPIFTQLRKVKTDVINPVDAHRLAVWMTKTAMVYESVAAGGSPVYFNREQRSQHREDRVRGLLVQGAFPRMRLFIGRYEGQSVAICMGQPFRVAAPGSSVHHRGYVLTVVLFGIVLDAMFPPPQISDLDGFAPREDWSTHLHQIWPAAHRQSWPPEESFNDDDPAIDHVPGRWSTAPRIGSASIG